MAFCQSPRVQRTLAVYWGREVDILEPVHDVEQMVGRVDAQLIRTGAASAGDRVVIVFGAPIGEMGHTNSVRLHQVGSSD